jgi:hypothetical protein
MDTKKQMTLHTNAINLARRLSVQNENDLMQVRRCPVAGRRCRPLLPRAVSERSPLRSHALLSHQKRPFQKENFLEDPFDEPLLMQKEPVTPTFTKDVCKEVASSMVRMTQLPVECTEYPEVVREIKRKGTDATPGASFLG